MKIKNETQLQHQIVMEFSQKYPEKYRQLIAINNEAANDKHAQKLKAFGVVPGVSDLMTFLPGKQVISIEVKIPGSIHKAIKIINQLNWIIFMESIGFEGYFCTSVEMFWQIYEGNIYQAEKIRSSVEAQLRNLKKTIKF
ncbi:MAG: hypothetical protein HN704_14730 [Bacteroidetes bacterium]|jgi:hypothetical protein|nr:hypothetical protein [Bacteroidota bacterium]MBT7492853.1 hypothetical protein [Bacteroidota bacterium]